MRVRYSGKPVGAGWHRLPGGAANVTGEPHSATAWYPADDHPSDKATFRLTATVPEGWTVIGKGRPGPTTSPGRGLKTYRWYKDSPLTTHVSTVAIDKFTVLDVWDHGMTAPAGEYFYPGVPGPLEPNRA